MLQLDNQIDIEEKIRRRNLLVLQQKVSKTQQRWIGSTQEILVEGQDSKMYISADFIVNPE